MASEGTSATSELVGSKKRQMEELEIEELERNEHILRRLRILLLEECTRLEKELEELKEERSRTRPRGRAVKYFNWKRKILVLMQTPMAELNKAMAERLSRLQTKLKRLKYQKSLKEGREEKDDVPSSIMDSSVFAVLTAAEKGEAPKIWAEKRKRNFKLQLDLWNHIANQEFIEANSEPSDVVKELDLKNFKSLDSGIIICLITEWIRLLATFECVHHYFEVIKHLIEKNEKLFLAPQWYNDTNKLMAHIKEEIDIGKLSDCHLFGALNHYYNLHGMSAHSVDPDKNKSIGLVDNARQHTFLTKFEQLIPGDSEDPMILQVWKEMQSDVSTTSTACPSVYTMLPNHRKGVMRLPEHVIKKYSLDSV